MGKGAGKGGGNCKSAPKDALPLEDNENDSGHDDRGGKETGSAAHKDTDKNNGAPKGVRKGDEEMDAGGSSSSGNAGDDELPKTSTKPNLRFLTSQESQTNLLAGEEKPFPTMVTKMVARIKDDFIHISEVAGDADDSDFDESLSDGEEALDVPDGDPISFTPHSDPPFIEITILAVGSRGDVEPFFHLARKLCQYGHTVRIASFAVYKDCFPEPPGPKMEFFPLTLPDSAYAFVGIFDETDITTFGAFLDSCLDACIQPWNTGVPFKCGAIISSANTHCHIHLAESLHVPLHIIETTPYNATRSFPHFTVANSLAGESLDEDGRAVEADSMSAAWLKRKLKSQGSVNFLSYSCYHVAEWSRIGAGINEFRQKKLNLKPLPSAGGAGLLETREVPVSYLVDPAMFTPRPADWREHIEIVGAVEQPFNLEWAPSGKLYSFLKYEPHPIFVSFGSQPLDNRNDAALQRAVMVKNLLTIVTKAAQASGVRVVYQDHYLTPEERLAVKGVLNDVDDSDEDDGKDPDGVKQAMFQPGAVMLINSDVPHDKIIPLCDAVCHHGGSRTMSTGLRYGKPTVPVPFGLGDQNFWATHCWRTLGVATLPIPLLELTSERLAKAFTNVTQDEALIERAKLLGAQQRNRETEGDCFDRLVVQFHNHLPSRLMCCDVDPHQLAVIFCGECEMKLSYKADIVVHTDPQFKNHVQRHVYKPVRWELAKSDNCALRLAAGFWAIGQEIADSAKNLVTITVEGAQRDGAEGAAVGALKGVSRLAVSPMAGVFKLAKNTAAVIDDTLKGDEALSLVKLKKNTMQDMEGPSGIVSGLGTGLAQLGKGIVDGLTGVITQPMAAVRKAELEREEHMQRGGVPLALLTGVGAGLLGLILRPTAGLLKFGASTFEGTREGVRTAARVVGRWTGLDEVPEEDEYEKPQVSDEEVAALTILLKTALEKRQKYLTDDMDVVSMTRFGEHASAKAKWEGYTPHTPVVIVPSLLGSSLYVKKSDQKPDWQGSRIWCDISKVAGYLFTDEHVEKRRVQRTMALRGKKAREQILAGKNAWLKHMALEGGCRDPPGLEVRVGPLQGLQALDKVMDGMLGDILAFIWTASLNELRQMGYEDDVNLFGCPYDWRLPPAELERRDGYFTNLRKTIETAYKQTFYYCDTCNTELAVKVRDKGSKCPMCKNVLGILKKGEADRPVALFAHSMGCLVSVYFMNWIKDQEQYGQAWIDKFIHTFVPLGGPFLGAPKALRDVVLGSDMGISVLSPDDARLLCRRMGNTPLLWPPSGVDATGIPFGMVREEGRLRIKDVSVAVSPGKDVFIVVEVNGRQHRSLKSKITVKPSGKNEKTNQHTFVFPEIFQLKSWEPCKLDDTVVVYVHQAALFKNTDTNLSPLLGHFEISYKKDFGDAGPEPFEQVLVDQNLLYGRPLAVPKSQGHVLNAPQGKRLTSGSISLKVEWLPSPKGQKIEVKGNEKMDTFTYTIVDAEQVLEREELTSIMKLNKEYYKEDPLWGKDKRFLAGPTCKQVHAIYGCNLNTPLGAVYMWKEVAHDPTDLSTPSTWTMLDNYASQLIERDGLAMHGGTLIETKGLDQLVESSRVGEKTIVASGDGTVPYKSLVYPQNWEVPTVKLSPVEDAEHRKMLSNPRVHDLLIKQVCKRPKVFVTVCVREARSLRAGDAFTGFSDPYVELTFRGKEFQSNTCKQTLNPRWHFNKFVLSMGAMEGEALRSTVYEPQQLQSLLRDEVGINVWDRDNFSTRDHLGGFSLDLYRRGREAFTRKVKVNGWYDLTWGKQRKGNGQVHVEFWFHREGDDTDSFTAIHLSTKNNEARSDKFYPMRFKVTDERMSWDTPFPEYDPPSYTAPAVIKAADRWADSEDFWKTAEFAKRATYEKKRTGPNLEPRNPRGRTGIVGRGLLGKWGANQAVDLVIVRAADSAELECILLERDDDKAAATPPALAIPGAFLLAGETDIEAIQRKILQELGIEDKPKSLEVLNELLQDGVHKTLVYRGYSDDSRNTDNAWVETTLIVVKCTEAQGAVLDYERKHTHEDGAARLGGHWVSFKDILNEKLNRKLFASHMELLSLAYDLIRQHGHPDARAINRGVSDVRKLEFAMRGWGTNNAVVNKIIGMKSSVEMELLVSQYQEEFHEDLITRIKAETSGIHEYALVGLLRKPAYFDAHIVKNALQGITNVRALSEVICTRTPTELKAISAAYEDAFKRKMYTDIDASEHGNYWKVLQLRLKAKPELDDEVLDEAKLLRDAKKLYVAGEKRLGKDASVFIQIIAGNTRKYCEALNACYAENYDITLDKVIHAEFSMVESSKHALRCLVTPLPQLFATLLFEAVKGFGARPYDFCRIAISQRERHLEAAAAIYLKEQRESLNKRISMEMHGKLKRLLRVVVKRWCPSKAVTKKFMH